LDVFSNVTAVDYIIVVQNVYESSIGMIFYCTECNENAIGFVHLFVLFI